NKVLPEFARTVRDLLQAFRYLPPVPWDADVVRAFARRRLAVVTERPTAYTIAIAGIAESLLGARLERELGAWRGGSERRLSAITHELASTERALADTHARLASPLTRLSPFRERELAAQRIALERQRDQLREELTKYRTMADALG